jgi:hypothetical protein
VVERYVNSLTVRLGAYDPQPLPEYLTEAATFTIAVSGYLDLDDLTDDVRTYIRGAPRRIEQTYSETSWGASGSGAALLIDLSSALGGLGGVASVADFVRSWLKDGSKGAAMFVSNTAEAAAEAARSFAAEMLYQPAETIQVTEVQPTAEGHRIVLESPIGNWVAAVSRDEVVSLKRGKRQ